MIEISLRSAGNVHTGESWAISTAAASSHDSPPLPMLAQEAPVASPADAINMLDFEPAARLILPPRISATGTPVSMTTLRANPSGLQQLLAASAPPHR